MRQSSGATRHTLSGAGATLGVLRLASPFIIKARNEIPGKIGPLDPIAASLCALAANEVKGAKWTVDDLNENGGILGRPAQLLVADSANDTGAGVQKTRKLIERDNVDAIPGDANSGIAYAMMGVAAEKTVFHLVPGGHTDTITRTDCKRGRARLADGRIQAVAGASAEEWLLDEVLPG